MSSPAAHAFLGGVAIPNSARRLLQRHGKIIHASSQRQISSIVKALK
ncbi:MAG TPA: hypothetical protein VKF38_02150 [Anaerolineaceae bacterium]|nr:hypothetical protein [Anaerolineaceae bacterium]